MCKGRGNRAPCVGYSGFQALHAIGEQPQRAVEAHVLVDSLHSPGALSAAVGGTAEQAPVHEIFLRLCGAVVYVAEGIQRAAAEPQHARCST
jgi:hypothetical protein